MPDLITIDELMNMGLPPIIIYAAPVMFSLVFLEWGISAWRKWDLYDKKDFWASTAIGVGNIIVSSFTKISIFALILLFYNLVPWRVPHTWWSYFLCFFFLDFCRYWAHRIAHEQRIWWATHVPHHSSEQYNFSVSFRLSWVQGFKVIFFVPVALAGFHPVVFFICHQIAVLYQFWIHTELIDKLPRPVEFFFVTPSHHRVHHATDDKYLDKNYGSTFIIWDRIFGSFVPEEETPSYGLTTPVDSYNPVYLVFHEFIDIWKDLKEADTWSRRRYVLFASPAEQARVKKERAVGGANPAGSANPRAVSNQDAGANQDVAANPEVGSNPGVGLNPGVGSNPDSDANLSAENPPAVRKKEPSVAGE